MSRKNIFTIASLCIAVMLILGATTAGAQRDEVTLSTGNPQFFVQNLTATVANNNQVAGTFSVVNQGPEVIGDIQYKIQILAPLPDIPDDTIYNDIGPLYYQQLGGETLAVGAYDDVATNFKIQIPPIPAGTYRLRIQTVSEKGRESTWQDTDISINTDSGVNFAILSPEAVRDNSDAEHRPLAGVNIDPGEQIELEYIAVNPGETTITATPRVEIYEFATTRELITTQTADTITITPGQTNRGSILVTAESIPEAYEAHVALFDGSNQLRSTDAEFRWVVRGPSAEIVSAYFAPSEKNSVAIQAEIAGAADGETQITGQIEVTLRAGGKDIETFTQSLNATDSTQNIIAQFNDKTRGRDTGFYIAVRDSSGKILDEYQYEVPGSVITTVVKSSSSLRQQVITIAFSIALIVLVILALVLIKQRRSPNNPNATPIAILLFATSAIALWWFTSHATSAATNGLYIKGGVKKGDVSLVINSPAHSSAITTPEKVRLEYRITGRSGCGNPDEDLLEQVEHLQGGGFAPPDTNFGRESQPNKCEPISHDGWVNKGEIFTQLREKTKSFGRVANIDLTNTGDPGAKTTLRVLGWRTDDFSGECNWTRRLSDEKRFEVEAWEHGYIHLNIDTPPAGAHQAATCQALSGWTCDANDFNKPLNVRLYDGEKDNGGIFLGRVTADGVGTDAIAAQCGGVKNKKWHFTVPQKLIDGNDHTIYAYAQNLRANGNNSNSHSLLSRSPQTINCEPPPNEGPVARFTRANVTVGNPIPVDASKSIDRDGEIVSYEWNVSNNCGQPNQQFSGVKVNIPTSCVGQYTVTLTVTDDRGDTDSRTKKSAVTEATQPGRSPIADFTTTSVKIETPLPLDGSLSSDPDGEIVRYDWLIDNSCGSPEQTATGKITSVPTRCAGDHVVTLTVTDNEGLTDTKSKTVLVDSDTGIADDCIPGNICPNGALCPASGKCPVDPPTTPTATTPTSTTPTSTTPTSTTPTSTTPTSTDPTSGSFTPGPIRVIE